MGITLHRTGKRSYETTHNGHHYEVFKEVGEAVWCITCDGEYKDGSYWLKEIKESIACGDYERS